jgi:hypothetical protein
MALYQYISLLSEMDKSSPKYNTVMLEDFATCMSIKETETAIPIPPTEKSPDSITFNSELFQISTEEMTSILHKP